MPDATATTGVASTAALIAAQQAAIAQTRAQILAIIRRLWIALPNYRDPDQFVAAVVPAVTAGQQRIAAITAAYLSHLYARLTGQPVRMIGVPADISTNIRAGVTAQDVYARPFHRVWRDLAAGQAERDAHYNWTGLEDDAPPLPPDDYVARAIEDGEKRAIELATTDLQLAKTNASQHVLDSQPHVSGYRRVLEGPYSCALCVVASTHLYHRAELMPIHPGCDCGVEPLVGDTSGEPIDSVARVNGDLVPIGDLPDIHARIAAMFGRDSSAARIIPGARNDRGRPIRYRDVLVTHEHGELGPVLAVRGQHWTGPGDLQPARGALVTTS